MITHTFKLFYPGVLSLTTSFMETTPLNTPALLNVFYDILPYKREQIYRPSYAPKNRGVRVLILDLPDIPGYPRAGSSALCRLHPAC